MRVYLDERVVDGTTTTRILRTSVERRPVMGEEQVSVHPVFEGLLKPFRPVEEDGGDDAA